MQGFLSQNLCLGRVGGIQLRVHLLCWLFFGGAVLAVLRDPQEASWWATLVGVWTLSVLIHELAHYLAARRHGGSPHEVVLWPLGGLVQLSAPRSPASEFAVALAGPLANALLCAAGAVVLYAQSIPPEDATASPSSFFIFFCGAPSEIGAGMEPEIVRLTTWINFWLASLNLLPAAPLDGARAGRAVLWSFVGYRRAARWMRGISLLAAAAVCLAPALLRARGVPVGSLVEVPLVALGVLLFCSAQSGSGRARKRPDDDRHDSDEWRVLGRPPHRADPFAVDEVSLGPAAIGQAVEARLEERLHRQQQQEEEEDRRVDEILSRLHVGGPASVSAEDQALLERVSARYRGRKSK